MTNRAILRKIFNDVANHLFYPQVAALYGIKRSDADLIARVRFLLRQQKRRQSK